VKPIVILDTVKPTGDLKRKLLFLNDLYFVKGSPINLEDLTRAGFNVAANIIVLADPSVPDKTDTAADGLPIMIFRMIKKSRAAFPVVDLVEGENAKFLGALAGDEGELTNPYYAAGQVYVASCLDTLLSQAYYNPFVIDLIEQLISGIVFPMNIGTDFPELDNKLYYDLMSALLSKGLLPLGLYSRSGGRLNYVLANPPANYKLRREDTVYVLNTSRSNSEGKEEILEEKREVENQEEKKEEKKEEEEEESESDSESDE